MDDNNILILDNALDNPESYRKEVLNLQFRTYDFGHCQFHGIALGPPSQKMIEFIKGKFPQLEPTLTFFRKSPLGQVEPHFIHTDADMGRWSSILYLSQQPPADDGTCFWTHKASGTIESSIPHERSREGLDRSAWEMRKHVEAVFNRILFFPSTYFHSRALFANHGNGDAARLTQVTFGEGQFW